GRRHEEEPHGRVEAEPEALGWWILEGARLGEPGAQHLLHPRHPAEAGKPVPPAMEGGRRRRTERLRRDVPRLEAHRIASHTWRLIGSPPTPGGSSDRLPHLEAHWITISWRV